MPCLTLKTCTEDERICEEVRCELTYQDLYDDSQIDHLKSTLQWDPLRHLVRDEESCKWELSPLILHQVYERTPNSNRVFNMV